MKAVLNRCSGPDAHYLIPEEFLDAERGAFEALGSPAAVEFYVDAHERKTGVQNDKRQPKFRAEEGVET
ncbi:MAG: hypothetical protein ABIR33_12225 [Pyrinomonadaceae bacterium]